MSRDFGYYWLATFCIGTIYGMSRLIEENKGILKQENGNSQDQSSNKLSEIKSGQGRNIWDAKRYTRLGNCLLA